MLTSAFIPANLFPLPLWEQQEMAKMNNAVNKHLSSLRFRDSIEGWGPDYDAAVKAAFDALQKIVNTPCGSDPVFFYKITYLDDHASTVDQLDDEYCCVADAVSNYLVERGVRVAA
jgi:hypothetical protein